MNKDIRLSVDFFDHPKTIKLHRYLGAEGVIALQRLWLYAAKHRCSGVLADMDEEEIAMAARWPNDVTTFVTTLVNVRWLDVIDGTYVLHDWTDHNGYAVAAEDRSDKARFSRLAKTHPRIYSELKEKGFDAIDADEYRRITTVKRYVNEPLKESLTERISPSPDPSPDPSPYIKPPIPPKGDERFVKFWQAYPKKVGKDAALRAWKKIREPTATLGRILAALEWQVKSEAWTKDSGQYIPNPATYLNQGRWQDEPTITRSNTIQASKGVQGTLARIDELRRRKEANNV